VKTQVEIEAEVCEYVLGLDGLGLGVKGENIRRRHQLREILPRLTRQRAHLRNAENFAQAALACNEKENRDIFSGRAAIETDKASALESELVQSWESCLENLKILWLVEGTREGP